MPRHCMRYLSIAAATLCGAAAHAAVFIDHVTLVSKAPQFERVAPAPHAFTVATAGRYRLDVRDVGFPAPLTAVDAIVTRGTQSIARLTQFGTADFDAVPGAYTIYISGSGPSAG